MDKQLEDFKWFKENYQTLFDEYGSCYLAIKDKKVLGSYQSRIEAINTTAKTEERGTFIVQKCNGDESAYNQYFPSLNLFVPLGAVNG